MYNILNRLNRLLKLPEVEPVKVETPEQDAIANMPIIPEETDQPVINDDYDNIEIDPVFDDYDLTEITETEISDEEKAEMDDEFDEGYMQYSSEVVGYENRELQWNAYRVVTSYIDSNSVIDFGCARGDYQAFYQSEYPEQDPLDYVGVESNRLLIEAGTSIYPGINIIEADWFNLDDSIQRDWAVNIASCNLRYDANLTIDDIEYTRNTISKMYQHCTRGLVIMLTSDMSNSVDELINHNPGDMLNWAQKEFGSAAIDHSIGDDAFCLIIYK
jgi:hypothetical protein